MLRTEGRRPEPMAAGGDGADPAVRAAGRARLGLAGLAAVVLAYGPGAPLRFALGLPGAGARGPARLRSASPPAHPVPPPPPDRDPDPAPPAARSPPLRAGRP